MHAGVKLFHLIFLLVFLVLVFPNSSACVLSRNVSLDSNHYVELPLSVVVFEGYSSIDYIDVAVVYDGVVDRQFFSKDYYVYYDCDPLKPYCAAEALIRVPENKIISLIITVRQGDIIHSIVIEKIIVPYSNISSVSMNTSSRFIEIVNSEGRMYYTLVDKIVFHKAIPISRISLLITETCRAGNCFNYLYSIKIGIPYSYNESSVDVTIYYSFASATSDVEDLARVDGWYELDPIDTTVGINHTVRVEASIKRVLSSPLLLSYMLALYTASLLLVVSDSMRRYTALFLLTMFLTPVLLYAGGSCATLFLYMVLPLVVVYVLIHLFADMKSMVEKGVGEYGKLFVGYFVSTVLYVMVSLLFARMGSLWVLVASSSVLLVVYLVLYSLKHLGEYYSVGLPLLVPYVVYGAYHVLGEFGLAIESSVLYVLSLIGLAVLITMAVYYTSRQLRLLSAVTFILTAPMLVGLYLLALIVFRDTASYLLAILLLPIPMLFMLSKRSRVGNKMYYMVPVVIAVGLTVFYFFTVMTGLLRSIVMEEKLLPSRVYGVDALVNSAEAILLYKKALVDKHARDTVIPLLSAVLVASVTYLLNTISKYWYARQAVKHDGYQRLIY